LDLELLLGREDPIRSRRAGVVGVVVAPCTFSLPLALPLRFSCLPSRRRHPPCPRRFVEPNPSLVGSTSPCFLRITGDRGSTRSRCCTRSAHPEYVAADEPDQQA